MILNNINNEELESNEWLNPGDDSYNEGLESKENDVDWKGSLNDWLNRDFREEDDFEVEKDKDFQTEYANKHPMDEIFDETDSKWDYDLDFEK